jgi:hypothetical protein
MGSAIVETHEPDIVGKLDLQHIESEIKFSTQN